MTNMRPMWKKKRVNDEDTGDLTTASRRQTAGAKWMGFTAPTMLHIGFIHILKREGWKQSWAIFLFCFAMFDH